MKLRLRSSFDNSVQASVALTVLLGTVVGCGDDDSTPPPFEIDGGVSSSSSATSEPTAVTPTSGDEPSETTGPHSTTNPTTTTSEDPTGEPTGPVDTSETPVETTSEIGSSTDLGTDGPTTGPVTSDLPTTGPVDTTGPGTEDTGGPVTPIGDGATDPPGDVTVISNFNGGDDQGFADGSGVTPTFTYANSVASLEIPFTHGYYQSGGLDFNLSGNYCGYELVARIKLVSGFDGDGGVQLRAWSSDWGQFVGSWANISSASDTGDWIEYSFDLDQAVIDQPPDKHFDQTAVNHVGIAILTGGSQNDVFTTATVEVDWIGMREKDGGCPGDTSGDTGSTNGGTDTGAVSDPDAGVVDTGETIVPGDAGVIDTVTPPEGDASVGEPTMGYGDASVSEPPATSSAPASTSAPIETSSEPAPVNMVSNGDFESGIGGWYSWVGTASQSTAKAHGGTHSLLVSGSGTGPAATQVVGEVAGETYDVSFWVSVGAGSSQVRLVRSLDCTGDATDYAWTVGNTNVSSSGWTHLTGTISIPADCDAPVLQVYAEGDGSNVDLYIDDASVTLAP